jgi:type II secretory pathway pseudopilin PulG
MNRVFVRDGRRRGRGFMLLDMMLAMGIATAVLLSLSVAVGTFRRAERRMADARALDRRLETALLTLQSGGKADPDLLIERLGEGPDHRAWVRVSLRSAAPPAAPPTGPEAGRAATNPVLPLSSASLVGLVPADQAVGGAP